MNEDQAPRQNRDGHPCPPWCQTDHDEVHGPAGTFAFHGGPVTAIEVPGKASFPDKILARAFHVGDPRWEPVVSVSGFRNGPDARDSQVWLKPSDAGELAAILDMLEDWDQVVALAEAIRKAAADITEGADPWPTA